MSNLHKSKQYDLIDMFNDTSRYLDDIFTIDNPELEKHIPDIYPTELQLNKAITSDKETSFLDLNIKVVGSDVHTSVYDKQNRSTEGCSKLKRSVDMTSSGKNDLNIRTNASPKWDMTRCPESKRPLLASRTRCDILWKPPKFGNKVKIGIKVQFGNKFANWYNI